MPPGVSPLKHVHLIAHSGAVNGGFFLVSFQFPELCRFDLDVALYADREGLTKCVRIFFENNNAEYLEEFRVSGFKFRGPLRSCSGVAIVRISFDSRAFASGPYRRGD